jgi:thioredoxin-related protein
MLLSIHNCHKLILFLLPNNILVKLVLYITILFQSTLFAQVDFQSVDFEEAQKNATKESKLVLIYGFARKCKPCREVKRVLRKNDSIQTVVDQKYVAIKFNPYLPLSEYLSEKYEIGGEKYYLPEILVLSPKGEVLARTSSLGDPKEIIETLESVYEEFYLGMSD